MSEAQLLYKLQTIDLDVEETTRLLQEIESKLGETEELLAARARLNDIVEEQRRTKSALHEAESEIEDLTAKLKPLESKLYGGAVKNPKELSALEKDVDMYKKKNSSIEDRVLELMSRLEELEATVKTTRAETEAVETEWRHTQGELTAERDRLMDSIDDLSRERALLAADIPQATIQIYEGLRKTRRGRAVATVERNTCQGCRVALPMTEVQRARTSRQLAFCSSCGRIIWVSR
ncbi:MAG: C4-type zinc ribbon domain-containing protein [Chloroflexi bacterium]|nr:C4-type zinc ribbon domain-containing protein [Chloroflexota bacterium]MDA8187234.1 C4-type zinc ribbon domain-containing protein [Dehalococcoidales bacterium]